MAGIDELSFLLPAAAQQQQMAPPMMPEQQQQAAPMMAPAAQGAPAYNPFMPSYRPDTVLSQPNMQNLAAQAWQRELENIAKGPSLGDKLDNGITQVFTRVVAPAVQAFGGLGTGMGAAEFMQRTKQDVLDAKAQRRQHQQDALTTVKALTDIINNTSPGSLKAVTAAAKLAQGDDANAIKKQQQERLSKGLDAKTKHWADIEARLTGQNSVANTLAFLKNAEQKRQFDEREKRIKEVAKNQQILTKRAQDIMLSGKSADREIEVAKLQAGIEQFNTRYQHLAKQRNAQLQMSASTTRTDPQTGQTVFVHQGADGKQIDVPAIPEDVGADFAFGGTQQYSDDPAVAQVLKQLEQPQPTEQPAAATPPKVPQAAIAKFLGRISKMNGQQIEQERALFQSRLGVDPYSLIQGASNGR